MNTKKLADHLRRSAIEASKISQEMAEAKSLRQAGPNEEPRRDLYHWLKPQDFPEWKAADILDGYDNRIEGLIRYNSEQVVARRVTDARLRVAYKALRNAANQFRDYAAQHRAKNTADGALKANRNEQMATMMEGALAYSLNPEDFGRP